MTLIQAVLDAQTGGPKKDGEFPHAPEGWSRDTATKAAQQEGLRMTDEHWDVVRALQEYFAKHGPNGINTRELHDALDEAFHADAASSTSTRSCRAGRSHRAAAWPGCRRRPAPSIGASAA